ncbi:sensor histidine kinase [Agathobaculum sp. Marseille-P7918]|uniref:sensor histidine kinase n=1 Tax=Agathobaculum sp. Marseille-P7918 TaxID=2479843 RepID=UPI000F639A65|nr:sensor histidine kinase [Agathobaculum sp. Marseille-P7918]
MRRKNKGKTFKQQLFLYFILSSVFICLVMGLFLYVSEQELVTDNLQQETQTAMGYAVDQAEQTALRVEEFANQVCRSDAVIDVMQRTSPQVDAQVLSIAAELNEQFQFVTITEEVLSLLLVGENGLDLRCGKEASLVDDAAIRQAFCRADYYGDSLMRWGVSQKNFCKLSDYPTVVPYSRRITDTASGQTLGYLVLLLRDTALIDACKPFLEQGDEAFCLMDETGGMIVQNARWRELTEQYGGEGTIFDSGTQEFAETVRLGGVQFRFFQTPVPSYPWQLVEAVPMYQYAQQTRILGRAAVVAACMALVLSLMLATVFSGQLVRPIERMVEAVQDIARGNFSRRLERSNRVELNTLQDSIEKMQTDLKQLLDSRVAQEQEKKTAEIQMLKAQINPHFLYNTLNSIKMMAVMQGARGIQNMIEALGSILRASLSNAEERTTLRDELALLEQYIYIQNIRYKGNIEYETVVRDQSLLDFPMQRCLLQPLLENAITHGIEQDNRGGHITLIVWRKWESLYISVEDDGVGIPPERLARLQNGERLTSRSIGVYNVDQRLRMTYGEAYGLRFESKPGEFTRVIARMKITEGDFAHEENADTDRR